MSIKDLKERLTEIEYVYVAIPSKEVVAEFTDAEVRYLEYYIIAQRMRKVEYLGGKTLYQFCLDYVLDEEDYSELYPLAYALNEGQQAMTKVFHYYDVVRYSATDYSEEAMEETLAPMEEKYGETPFNVYEGVDRTIYYGTFALTSAAERADAMTDENTLADAFFGQDSTLARDVTLFTGGACLMLVGYAVLDISKEAAKVAGGGGGGRPDMAQAGGKDVSKLADALAKAEEVLASQVNG